MVTDRLMASKDACHYEMDPERCKVGQPISVLTMSFAGARQVEIDRYLQDHTIFNCRITDPDFPNSRFNAPRLRWIFEQTVVALCEVSLCRGVKLMIKPDQIANPPELQMMGTSTASLSCVR